MFVSDMLVLFMLCGVVDDIHVVIDVGELMLSLKLVMLYLMLMMLLVLLMLMLSLMLLNLTVRGRCKYWFLSFSGVCY